MPAGVVRARAAELGFPNACDPAAPVSGEMADLHDAVALRQDTPVSVSLLLRRLLRFDWHVARVAAAPDESDRDSGDHRVATVAIPRQWFRDRWPEPDPSNRQMVQLLGPATRRTRKPAPPTLVSRPRRRYAGAMPTIDHCPGCPYREFGPAVGPRGNPASRIVLVGEAPGKNEIEAGRPFVGPAGHVLAEALAEAGISEANLFITNAVACMPHPVHPWVKAIDACRGRLVLDIEAHPRAVVVALGLTAVRAVTGGRGFRMMDSHGVELATVWGPVVPTLHPARVLRRPTERPMLVADLKHARRLTGI